MAFIYLAASINALISSTRQAVVRGPNLMGFGYFPDLTPSHQELLLTGISCKIKQRRTKPIIGKVFDVLITTVPPFASNFLNSHDIKRYRPRRPDKVQGIKQRHAK